jgi:hypothetical protein
MNFFLLRIAADRCGSLRIAADQLRIASDGTLFQPLKNAARMREGRDVIPANVGFGCIFLKGYIW